MRRLLLDCGNRALVDTEAAFNAYFCIDDGYVFDSDGSFGADICAGTAGGAFGIIYGYHLITSSLEYTNSFKTVTVCFLNCFSDCWGKLKSVKP